MNDVCAWSASEIARRVAGLEVTAQAVTDACIARIEAVNPALNAVVVKTFEEARHTAAAVDAAVAQGDELGPLAGVPVTVKECFHLAGTASTMGIRRLAGEIRSADSPLVARLRRAGAVILGKTNVPHLMLMFETDSPLFGRSNHPTAPDRGPGGSTGGEAAIIAAGGSALGLGGDLGGSIRQPAHACGIHGFKPTTGRLTNAGSLMGLRGMEAIGVQPGPLARSVQDLVLGMNVFAGHDELDRTTPPLPPLSSGAFDASKLRVGVWEDDGYFPASPAIRRAVREAAAALEAAGATIVPFAPPAVGEAMGLYFGLLSADGGAEFRRWLGGDPPDWRIGRLIRLANFPRVLRRPASWLLAQRGHRRLADLLVQTGRLSSDEYWQRTYAVARYAASFMHSWAAAGLDVMLCPPHALPALKHGSSAELTSAGSYCYLPNLLGVPAGVVAATRVRPGEESDRAATRDPSDGAAQEVEQGSAGLPVGVQVLAPHWQDSAVLSVMAFLESHFRETADYPIGREASTSACKPIVASADIL